MENQCYRLKRATVVEKITEARTVAYTRFFGIQEVGRQIWKVRDWIKNAGYRQIGYPSCIYDLPGCDGSNPQDCLCEVQWDLQEGLVSNSIVVPNPIYFPEPGECVWTKQVEPERVLSILHLGDTEEIEDTIVSLELALRAGNYQKDGPRREIYQFDVHLPKSRWVTEIQIPVFRQKACTGVTISDFIKS
jgi:hypothetical protein